MSTLHERFTTVADKVSEGLGTWWFTVASFMILFLWILYGFFILSQQTGTWFTSSQWNFPLNTITTVGEWFIGALVAAAANRVERRHDVLLETIKQQAEASVKVSQRDVAVSHKNEQDLAEIKESLTRIELHFGPGPGSGSGKEQP